MPSRFWYIDRAGEFVVPPIYDGVTEFSDGRGQVRTGAVIGYVSRDGHEVIPRRFGYAADFHEGLAAAREWDVHVHGPVTRQPRALLAHQETRSVGYIDRTGRYVIQPA